MDPVISGAFYFSKILEFSAYDAPCLHFEIPIFRVDLISHLPCYFVFQFAGFEDFK